MSNFDSLVIPSPIEYVQPDHELYPNDFNDFLIFVNAWNEMEEYHTLKKLVLDYDKRMNRGGKNE